MNKSQLAESIATRSQLSKAQAESAINALIESVTQALKNGEAVTHDLPAGPHRIRVHNTLFWKNHELVLQPGEHARFKAANKAGWGSFGFLMVLGAAPLYLTFEREQ